MKNVNQVYVSDTAYKINSRGDVNINSFVYSFYNVITLIYAELMGRKYGGGVLELTPNEFKDLPILYKKINYSVFKKFAEIVKNNNDIFNILDKKSNEFSDFDELLTKKESLQLKNIYKKLINSRIR